MPNPPLPTDAELQLLRVLWRDGPGTVRQVHDTLAEGRHDADERQTGYTTTLKLLQNMHGKGLARRDDGGRQHVYAAAVPEDPTLGALVGRLVDRLFDGSAAALAIGALDARPPSPAEIRELQALLDRL